MALKRRKTLQTYVLLGQMGNSSSILSMPSLSSESFTNNKSMHRVMKSLEEIKAREEEQQKIGPSITTSPIKEKVDKGEMGNLIQ